MAEMRNSRSRKKTITVSKQVKQHIASFNSYSSTDAVNTSLMNTVKTLYTSRDITNIKTAKSDLHLLNSNIKSDVNTFTKQFTHRTTQTTHNTATTQVKRNVAALQEE